MRKETGITLIALVLTVIILLILAGVAMSMITGNAGIFTKANEAATLYNQKAQEEADQVQGLMDQLDQYAGGENSNPGTTKTTVSTPITTAINNMNIGDYIDLETNLLTETVLPGTRYQYDYNTNRYIVDERLRDDEEIKTDYRILYKDENKVYAILAYYLPNSTNIVSSLGNENIEQISENGYAVYFKSSDALLQVYTRENNSSLISALAGNKLASKNVSVTLSPRAEILLNSYNFKNGTNINISEILNNGSLEAGRDLIDDSQSLYMPEPNGNFGDETYGYWFGEDVEGRWELLSDGALYAYTWWYDVWNMCSIRPVVCLGSDVYVKWNNTREVWEVQ